MKVDIAQLKKRRPRGVMMYEFEDGKISYLGKFQYENYKSVLSDLANLEINTVLNSIIGGDFDTQTILKPENEEYLVTLIDVCNELQQIADVSILRNEEGDVVSYVSDNTEYKVAQISFELIRKARTKFAQPVLQKEEVFKKIYQGDDIEKFKREKPDVFFGILAKLDTELKKKKGILSPI